MIQRRKTLSLLSAVTLTVTLFGKAQLADAQSPASFDTVFSDITHGRVVIADRVSISADNIVKEDEPLRVTVDIFPADDAKDEEVHLHLLMSEGPWPRAYTAGLRTHGGYARVATRLRVPESCVLHAIAEFDGEKLFGATHEVKVSAGAYSR